MLVAVPAAITVQNLFKSYGEVAALDGVCFTVAEGEVLALLGPNGAGKTTAVEILEGYRRADEGEIEVLGFHPAAGGRRFRDRIGIVLQETGVEEVLTVREAVELYGMAYTRQRPVDELVSLVGLDQKADARVKTLSGGQRRRLDLALGLVGDPDLVFLDEPTTGFDPAARRKSWELVEGLTALGKTILLTTHYLDEAQHLADRIIVLAEGRIVAEGTPETLGSAQAVTTVRFNVPDTANLPVIGEGPEIGDNKVTYRSTDPTADLYTLTKWATERGVELAGLEVTRPSLEDMYLDIMEEADRSGDRE